MDSKPVVDATAVPVSHINLGGVVRIPAVRQVMLLIGIAASVAAGVAIVLWSQAPGYAALYGDLDVADAAQVTEALRASDIKYKLNTETGAVMVPESRLHDARLELASQGLPQGASAGMNMLQEQSSFGVSQFMESARYQHALETELARTIASLGAVRDARIHLALPKQSAFIRDQKDASASVLLQLQQGRQLEADQASAIVHLLASSVPNLLASNVTVIDQHGHMLSSGDDPYNDALTSGQFKYARRLEETYKRRIEELLTPLVGPGRVRAQVVADLDFTVAEETRESFDPAKTTIRSEQLSEEQRRGSLSAAQGVPGALSNQPPVTAADAAGESQSASEQADLINSARSSTRNYEVDRTISHTRQQSGTIRRLSVAVLLDDSPMPGATTSEQPALTDAEVQRFTVLVKEAVGFNEARGDTVAVVNAAFRSLPEVAPAEKPKIWEQPILRDTMKLVLGAGLVLALAFGLIRPMLRGILANDARVTEQYLGGGSAVMLPAGTSQLPGAAAALAAPNYDDKLTAAKNITGHDPARVAQVVAKWVSTDD